MKRTVQMQNAGIPAANSQRTKIKLRTKQPTFGPLIVFRQVRRERLAAEALAKELAQQEKAA